MATAWSPPELALLIDTASAARALSEPELRAWAEGRGVFVSSVMEELPAERRALADLLTGLGFRPILFEDLGGRDENAETAYLAGVAQAEIYLGLIDERYGTMLPSGRSPTHEEYRKARELGRRVSVWSREPSPHRQGNARDFLAEIQVFNTTGRFQTTEDLLVAVRRRLGEIAAEDEAPWVKLRRSGLQGRADSRRGRSSGPRRGGSRPRPCPLPGGDAAG